MDAIDRHDYHCFERGKLPQRIRAALRVLLEALHYAEQTSGDRWEFAVEFDQLVVLGLTLNDFRWLVRMELVEHRREVTIEDDDGRAFQTTGDLTFPQATCFVLTDKGVSFACGSRPDASSSKPSSSLLNHTEMQVAINGIASSINDLSASELGVPCWNKERRELCLDGITIKRFKWAAANQEAILAAFEEEGWPHRIDDPISPQPEQDSKRRLSDTIKYLNRKQQNELIRFHGDGSGEGVVWEMVEQDEAETPRLFAR